MCNQCMYVLRQCYKNQKAQSFFDKCLYSFNTLYILYFILYSFNITFLPIHSSFLTYKGHMRDKPSLDENLGFCYRPISMLNNITIDSIRGVFKAQLSFYDEFL